MAAIRVRAAKSDDPETIVFNVDGAGLDGERPTVGIVKADGKTVTLDGRHRDVKQALRDGTLVEVRAGPKAKSDDAG